jgi:NADPH:quinone reductase-like Zn-dependent oxidoreductase
MAHRQISSTTNGSLQAIPDTMKAAGVDRFGPPSALTLHEVPVPRPAPHEVLIAVHTAGIGRKLGAHRVIDARRAASMEQLRRFAPDGLDGVLALAGGDELERCLDFMRSKGHVVYPNGIEPVPMARRTFRVRAFDAIAAPREFDKLNHHLGNGRIRVPIAASYPLGKAALAHRRLDREHAMGRMVLRIRHDGQ